MGLKDAKKASSDLIVDGIWEKVVSKTGKVYDNIQKLKDLDALDDTLSNLLQEKIEAALADGSLKEADLKDYMKGYTYKHTDGWEYQVVDKGTTWQITRKKPFAAGGGWKKGGTFIHLRTTAVKVGKIEQVQQVIANQTDTDNWRITEITGNQFLMENQQSYAPVAATSSTTTEKKDDSAEEETE